MDFSTVMILGVWGIGIILIIYLIIDRINKRDTENFEKRNN